MSALRRLILRVLAFFRSGRAEDELAREIGAHLRLLEDRFLAQGMSAADARDAARRAFGGVEQVKERQRDTRSFRWLDESWMDLKLGARMLIKYPGLAFVAALGIAVAIAIGAVTFTVFYTLMDPDLPLSEGERVVGIENWDSAWNNQERRILHDFVTWRDELTSIREIGAFRAIDRNLIVRGAAAEQVAVAEITAAGLRVARVPPLLGRPLVDDDEPAGAPSVTVIGYDVWQGRFAGDANVVGRTVQLGSDTYTVVGVMPQGFAFPINQRFWVPLRADPADYARRRGPQLFVIGRLAPGATIESAEAEVSTIGRRMAAAFPQTHERLRPRVVPYAAQFFDDTGRWELHAGQLFVSLLLVVVSVNVTILVYARTATRQGEIAVRTALGASRRRIVAQLFVEALVLSAASAVVGVVFATLALTPVNAFFGAETGGRPPFWMRYELSLGAVLYVAGLALVAALIVGVAPALKATGRRVQSPLRQLNAAAGLQLGRTWTALIVLQVAISVAVLPSGVFTGWQSIRLARYDPGFAAEEFLIARLGMERDVPPTAEAAAYQRAFTARFASRHADIMRRLRSEPGVAGITYAWSAPGRENQVFLEVDGVPAPPQSGGAHDVSLGRVDIDFFAVFNVPILGGRGFESGDLGPATTAAIVNRAFVQQVFGGGSVLGRRVRDAGIVDDQDEDSVSGTPGPWLEIVGVVDNLPAHSVRAGSPRAVLYRPLAPGQIHPITLALHAPGANPAVIAARLREITAALDPTLRLDDVSLLDAVFRRSHRETYLEALLFGGVALSVLLLSAAGIYALMSFTVTRRRREIGIRAALGADARRILAGIFARALGQLALGLAVGVTISSLLEWLTNGDLMGGQGATVLPVVGAIMLTVGLLAAAGPARRGLRIQPIEALREE